MKKLILLFSALSIAGCVNSTGGNGKQDTPPNSTPPSSKSNSQSPHQGELSLILELSRGKRLIFTFEDRTLTADLNTRMGTRNPVALQDGRVITTDDPKKGYCQVGTDNGFLSRGDRFEVAQDKYSEKVYLGTTRAVIHVSDYVGMQCFKGGFDQDDMTLTDLKTILGSLVRVELQN